MTTKSTKSIDVFGATLTRRQFVKTGGILAVGISVVGPARLRGDTPKVTVAKNSLDPSLASSWLEIHADNTVTIRTGKSDFGQGSVYTSYRQIVAEELSMRFEAIASVVLGRSKEMRAGLSMVNDKGCGAGPDRRMVSCSCWFGRGCTSTDCSAG